MQRQRRPPEGGRYKFKSDAQIAPAGWLRLGSRTQSSLRRSRRIVSWSSPCHPQGFLPASLPNRAALLAEQAARTPAGNLFDFLA